VGIYVVAGCHLCGLIGLLRRLGAHGSFNMSQSETTLWSASLNLQLSVCLMVLLLSAVVVGFVLRPKGERLSSPGCVPGSICALLGSTLLQVYVVALLFGAVHVDEERRQVKMALDRSGKEEQIKVESQNQASESAIGAKAALQYQR
jgi:hypothetical protein